MSQFSNYRYIILAGDFNAKANVENDYVIDIEDNHSPVNDRMNKCKAPKIPPLLINNMFILNSREKPKLFTDFFCPILIT